MQGIFRKENTDKALKYGIYRHLPTYEKIIRNLVSFYKHKTDFIREWWEEQDVVTLIKYEKRYQTSSESFGIFFRVITF